MLPEPSTVRQQWAQRYPELDTSAMQLAELLKRVSSQLERAIEPLYDGVPLTMAEFDLLIPLRHMDEPVMARRIAEHRNMSNPGVSKALGKLEQRGLVERVPSPADRRATLVSITESGKEAVDALFPRQVAVESQLFAGLGADRERVIEALQLLAETLDAAVPDRTA